MRRYVSMMTITARLAVLLGLVLAAAGSARAQGELAKFEHAEISIETAEGARYGFQIELAETAGQQQQGLMFRRSMASDAGMLFIYRPRQRVSMWMKNTVLPLDMLFISEKGRIVKIVERTVPLSLTTISSDRPVRAVLELNGGTVSRLGISTGDRVHYEVFDPGS